MSFKRSRVQIVAQPCRRRYLVFGGNSGAYYTCKLERRAGQSHSYLAWQIALNLFSTWDMEVYMKSAENTHFCQFGRQLGSGNLQTRFAEPCKHAHVAPQWDAWWCITKIGQAEDNRLCLSLSVTNAAESI